MAWPQYERAVLKSRYFSMVPLVKSLADAQETYFLANGQYAKDLTQLDVEIPSSLRCISGGGGGDEYETQDGRIRVGLAMDKDAFVGVQFMFPDKMFGYRITLNHSHSYLPSGVMWGGHYCIENHMAVRTKYCPWIAGRRENLGVYWLGYWYPMQ